MALQASVRRRRSRGAANGPRDLRDASALCLDRAEQPVGLPGGSGGEEQGGRRSGRAVVAELQRPQPRDHDLVAVEPLQAALVLELAVRLRLEDVDHAVAEVSDQQTATGLTEVA